MSFELGDLFSYLAHRSLPIPLYATLRGSRYRRSHTRAYRAVYGGGAKLCSRRALGERGIIARDFEIYR